MTMRPAYFSALSSFQKDIIRRVLAGENDMFAFRSYSLRVLRLNGWVYIEDNRVHLTDSAYESYKSHPYQRVYLGKRA